MKVAYTSDIHADITSNNKSLMPYLVKRVKEINPDVFVIAGDISNSIENLNNTLNMFSRINCHKVMVPGNHDIWTESNNSIRKGRDSFYKYKEAIPDACKQNGFVYPIAEPFVIDNVAIAGSIGWYDYSLRDDRLDNEFGLRDYDKGSFEDGVWNDSRYAIWLKTPDSTNWRERLKSFNNTELFEILFNELKDTVGKIPETTKKVLIVLHTAPLRECIVPKEIPSPFDAYEGSIRLGEFINSISKDREVSIICGHRHKKLFLDLGRVKLYRSPAGYLNTSQADYESIANEVIGEFNM